MVSLSRPVLMRQVQATHVVCGHLHPLLEVGQDRHAFHGGNGISADVEGVFVVIAGGVLALAGQGLATSDGGCGGADLVHLGLMEGLARLKALGLLLLVIVERHPARQISGEPGDRRVEPDLMGACFWGVATDE